MTGTKFDIEKFDKTGDFGLWRVKMRALLIQHGCEAALEVLPEDTEAQEKAELNKKAHSAVILCLGSKVLREVIGKTTAAEVWTKLETLYMTKSLANKLYLKNKLYTFYMPAGRKISEHIYEFNKIVLDLANIEIKFEDEDLALLLLTTLPASHEHFEIKEKSKAKGNDGEGLYVRGRTDRRDSRQSREVKKSTSYVKKDDQPSSSGLSFDDSKVMSAEALQDLIMDSGCSYHMTPRYIFELKRNLISLGTLEKEGYTIKMQSSKVNMINGSMVVLSGTQMANCVYSLDGHVVACELDASVDEIDSLAQVWHKRLGHISKAGLHVVEKQGLFGKESLDLWGLSQVESLEGKRYFLSIVDDYSKKSGLPKTFWAEATCMATYLINRSPSTVIKKKTPIEMWSGHPSDYTMLKIFSCVAYSHVKQGKLKLRVVKCVLLGYPEGVKEYRLYRLDGKPPKIVTSRNVVFNESFMYKDMLKNSGVGDDKSVEKLQLTRDREPKTRTKPLRFQDESNMAAYAFVAAKEEDTHESLTYQDAVELVDPPIGQKLVSSKWLFKIKEGIECVQKHRYKASLVARGFTQRPGIVYNKIFSLVIRHTSIRVILALTACKDYELEQLDVKMAFLHENLEEVIYMRQPPGYKQGNRVEIGSTKSLLKKEFNMKELGEAKKILGMEIVRDQSRKIMRVSQSGYVSKILNNFRIDNGKSIQMPLGGHFKLSLKDCPVRDFDVERMSKVSYANAVGSLMYLMVCTRPDVTTRNFPISNLAVSV
nr:hypothetical protein [Tanacetum cinerariifolium]